MKLHRVIHNHTGKLWCGVAALSAITGNPSKHSKETIRHAIDNVLERSGRRIKGIYLDEMLAALDYMMIDSKCIWERFSKADKVSLARMLHKFKCPDNKLFLIVIEGHFLVCNQTTIVDTLTPNGCAFADYQWLDSNIVKIYEIGDSILSNL